MLLIPVIIYHFVSITIGKKGKNYLHNEMDLILWDGLDSIMVNLTFL